jgi:hypothetical protein
MDVSNLILCGWCEILGSKLTQFLTRRNFKSLSWHIKTFLSQICGVLFVTDFHHFRKQISLTSKNLTGQLDPYQTRNLTTLQTTLTSLSTLCSPKCRKWIRHLKNPISGLTNWIKSPWWLNIYPCKNASIKSILTKNRSNDVQIFLISLATCSYLQNCYL